jgi:hypothetical protein
MSPSTHAHWLRCTHAFHPLIQSFSSTYPVLVLICTITPVVLAAQVAFLVEAPEEEPLDTSDEMAQDFGPQRSDVAMWVLLRMPGHFRPANS